MPSLKDFVAALQAGWFTALVAFVGCAIIIAGDYYKLPYLDVIPKVVITSAVIIGIFAFSIIIANIVHLPIAVWKAIRRRRALALFKEKVAREIEEASDSEKYILGYLLATNRKAFQAEFGDRWVAPLVSKGLVIAHGGTHSVLEWPYSVRQEAWDYLIENRHRFRIEPPPDGRDLFHWSNRRLL